MLRHSSAWVGLVGLSATLHAACGGESVEDQVEVAEEAAPAMPVPASVGNEVATEYAPALNIDLSQMTKTESGLHYQVLEEGAGEAVDGGDRVSLEYTGWLPNGEQFESATYTFTIGAGEVIGGWDEGTVGMKPGETRRLVIPPALGYGAMGSPGAIPPNATLVFDVRLPPSGD